MADRMHRTQVLIPEGEYRHYKKVAEDQGRSFGGLVREALAKQYPPSSVEKRLEAVRRLARMRLPVSDWPEMEEEIVRGAVADE